MVSSSPPAAGARDRLSNLPDFLLGHVLSYLHNKEAARAAALARRWRHVFCNVHSVSFSERPGERANDWTTFYFEAQERKSCSAVLLDDVWSALLCRRRCAGTHVPLRRFRFAFDQWHHWNTCHVDQWLAYVLRNNSMQDLHLDLRFRLGPICPYADRNNYEADEDEEAGSGTDNSDADAVDGSRSLWSYVLPKGLFTCTTIRTLCIGNCGMKLPSTIDLPFVETLSITAPQSDGERSVQRLISSCPRLIDLTLEAIACLKRVSVLDKRLRRFALRCCHKLRSVHIDASELRSLDYQGAVPSESLLSLHGSPGVPSCTVHICKVPSTEHDHVKFIRFMEKISDAKNLHLHHRCLPAMTFGGFPTFANLTRLALQGPLQSPRAMRVILEHTPNLEILSLFMEELSSAVNPDDMAALEKSSFSLPCLLSRVREINMVHYTGDEMHRTMAWLLFSNALVLELCVVLVKGAFVMQDALRMEIEGWVGARDVDQIFL